jgi:hypothetical protein
LVLLPVVGRLGEAVGKKMTEIVLQNGKAEMIFRRAAPEI